MAQSRELALVCRAVLETLVECNATKDNPCIASTIYLAMNANMALYEAVTTVMVRLGWIGKTTTQVWVTQSGIEVIQGQQAGEEVTHKKLAK